MIYTLKESLFAGLLVLSCCTAMIRKQFTFIAGACLQELKSVGGLTLISERVGASPSEPHTCDSQATPDYTCESVGDLQTEQFMLFQIRRCKKGSSSIDYGLVVFVCFSKCFSSCVDSSSPGQIFRVRNNATERQKREKIFVRPSVRFFRYVKREK